VLTKGFSNALTRTSHSQIHSLARRTAAGETTVTIACELGTHDPPSAFASLVPSRADHRQL